jgi:hypothetical protein
MNSSRRPRKTAAAGRRGPGTTTEEPTTEEPTVGSSGGPVAYDINGDFLLAVSTTVDPGKPLQFIATNTVTDDGATLKTSACSR